MSENSQDPVYLSINMVDDGLNIKKKKKNRNFILIIAVTKIESMCMRCEKNGETRILLKKIPFFRG